MARWMMSCKRLQASRETEFIMDAAPMAAPGHARLWRVPLLLCEVARLLRYEARVVGPAWLGPSDRHPGCPSADGQTQGPGRPGRGRSDRDI